MTRRLRQIPRPLVLLAVVCAVSLGARLALIDEPCRHPCRTASDHVLIFDEAYYVNAARVIAGINPPSSQHYSGSPAGVDPNSEHPQLAKLWIAASIELFGDTPIAWRLTSILLGTVAILGMYALVRAAGAERWPAVAAGALMAADNLLLVHGRIATLDVPVVAAMIWGVVLYLRGRPLLGGVVLGIGACIKLVAPYALFVLVALELLRLIGEQRPRLTALAARLATCVTSAAVTFVGLLAILDRIAPPFDPLANRRLASGPFHHIAHMLSYAAQQTSPDGPTGIASYPWTWLVDYRPITYLNINPSRPSAAFAHVHPASHWLGMISPPIMLLALPAIAVIVWELARAVRGRGAQARAAIAAATAGARQGAGELPLLALAWILGTFLPFVLASLLLSRTSYLYYMVIVMPGIYVAIIDLLLRARRYRPAIWVWASMVAVAAVIMYPFTPLP